MQSQMRFASTILDIDPEMSLWQCDVQKQCDEIYSLANTKCKATADNYALLSINHKNV